MFTSSTIGLTASITPTGESAREPNATELKALDGNYAIKLVGVSHTKLSLANGAGAIAAAEENTVYITFTITNGVISSLSETLVYLAVQGADSAQVTNDFSATEFTATLGTYTGNDPAAENAWSPVSTS